MSRGPAGLIIWLGLISLVVVVVTTTAVLLIDNNPDNDWTVMLWNILFQTMTPNPVDPKDQSVVYLGGMLFVTMVSLFLVSIFIGILTNTIDQRIQSLRKGRSLVIEKNHTLILGWSEQVFTIISELVEANANRNRPCIAILADKDKIEMEDEIRAKVPHTRNTRVVCRTGSPLDIADLEIMNPHAARSIIILAPEADDPDTHVIKALLAVTNNPHRKEGKYHIVAEIRNEKNLEIAKMVGRDEAEIVLGGDLISRITVQTCRQSGLSVVYTELLNFGGDEIYFKEESSLVGKAFGSALLAYDDSAVIGLKKGDQVKLNPPMDTRIAAGDQIIAIAQDDDTIKLTGTTNLKINADAIQTAGATNHTPERTLILGWNRWGMDILRELDDYVAPDSETIVVANVAELPSLDHLKNQKIEFHSSDTTNRHTLNALDIPSFNHVIVLSYSDTLDAQEADANTLITLLHLRAIKETSGKEFSIVSEMLDVRNRQLAEVTHADDFIVSDQLISLWLSQVSENKFLSAVFQDLFDPEGSEIYLKRAEGYVKLDTPMNFYTVVEAARQRGQVAIGYRQKKDALDAEKSYGVHVNPKKSDLVTFTAGDKIIVLAEN